MLAGVRVTHGGRVDGRTGIIDRTQAEIAVTKTRIN
jgi:hypothetical protein